MIKSTSFSLNGSLSLNKDELFSNIQLEIQLNQWTVIIGQSGTGKSTLLKIIANLNIPVAFITIYQKILMKICLFLGWHKMICCFLG